MDGVTPGGKLSGPDGYDGGASAAEAAPLVSGVPEVRKLILVGWPPEAPEPPTRSGAGSQSRLKVCPLTDMWVM